MKLFTEDMLAKTYGSRSPPPLSSLLSPSSSSTASAASSSLSSSSAIAAARSTARSAAAAAAAALAASGAAIAPPPPPPPPPPLPPVSAAVLPPHPPPLQPGVPATTTTTTTEQQWYIDQELLIVAAICSTLISVTGLVMASMLCNWCFGRKRGRGRGGKNSGSGGGAGGASGFAAGDDDDDDEEQAKLNDYRPVPYGGADDCSRSSVRNGYTPNGSPSQDGGGSSLASGDTASCSSTQKLTSVGKKNKKTMSFFSGFLSRFERHHNVDKYKMVSEQTMPPTNVNQMSTTALEDNMAFAYQQQNGNRIDEESPEQTSLLSVPEEETTDAVEEVSPDLPPKEYDQRKASTTSGLSTSSLSELIGLFFHKGGRHKSEKNPTLPDPNLPGTSGESYKIRIKEARESRKQNRRRSSLANYRSWWSYIRTRLPEIAALNNEQKQKKSEKMTMKQMYERRSSLFSHDKSKSKSKNEFFRRFSLNTPSTEKERHEMAATSSTTNIHQIVGSFKQRFHSRDNPLHSRANAYSKQRERQRKRKCREQNKRKMYTGNSQVTRSRSPSFTVPQKSSKHSHKSKKRNPAFASIDQEAAYVSLITRRRKLEQMRRRYMQDVAMRKEMGGFDSDPQIPADVEL
ncbi:Hypothetical predicted protein [Octopus vulgaris]|uniref:Uncharacterized protein n=1 Tax=Octopus vulgaris TaxID=6645 RepID=A0AA36BW79_OCTVU|nr:Hypothetical predicted protein [Octopus vulgaris]